MEVSIIVNNWVDAVMDQRDATIPTGLQQTGRRSIIVAHAAFGTFSYPLTSPTGAPPHSIQLVLQNMVDEAHLILLHICRKSRFSCYLL